MTALFLATPPSQPGHSTKRPRSWRWFLVGLAGLSAGVAAGFGWQSRSVEPKADLTFAVATQGPIEATVTALGKIQPRDYVDVGAQVSGQLKRVAVSVGDMVKAGALLAEIDPQLQAAKLELDRAQLTQLEAERSVQQLQAEFSGAQYQRQLRMKQDGAAREDVVDRTHSELRIASAKLTSIDAQIRQAQSTIKADEAQLGYTRIFAPMSGTVISIDARAGQTLIASQQAPVLLRIADLSSMTVWSQVSEADIVRLHPGMALYFTTLGHVGRRWDGKLRQVLPAPPRAAGAAASASPSALNNVVLYTALFDVDNPGGELLPEMSAQVFFVTAASASAIVIPVTALHAAASDETVTHDKVTVAGALGRLETREVTIGVRNRFDAQIVEGLQTGERVVKRALVDEDAEAQP